MVTALSLFAGALTTLSADEFDLNSQRGEVQEFKSVPGKKLDHHGLVINPTPQKLTMGGAVLKAPKGFTVKSKIKGYVPDINFLTLAKKGGTPLTIDFGAKAAAKAGVEAKDGAYTLDITPGGINIVGYNETGAFYALQTLRQIAASDMAKSLGGLPILSINDYPSMKYRGIVEGFYGTPWSHAKRMSLLDFYGANKLNNYIFGPKDDPYHSSPYWRQPYPEKEAAQIRELVERAKANHVDFVWAIHPGKDIRWNKEDYDSLVRKFEMMYDLGVRHFSLFFDDIEGIGTDPHQQAKLLNDLNRDFVEKKGDVGNILICPTDYSQLWAKPGPEGPLAIYGRELNPNAEVFWTGAVVCSDLTPETLQFINSRIKRPALYWWNYPVTDYCKHIMLQGPVYGLDITLTPEQVSGIESNPMEHAEASKLALYSVADYAWNTPAYNAIDSWERGLVNRMPGAPDAYRTFAIHSTDTETGYRRDESWETDIFPFDNYTTEQYAALKAEFERVAAAPAQIRERGGNQALIEEIDPWLTQLEGVGKRGLAALDLIKIYENGPDSTFWAAYVDAQLTPEAKKAYEAHKVGTMKLHPFYENAMKGMLSAFYKKLTGTMPAMYKGVGSYANMRTTQPFLMLDNDTTTFYTSGTSQSANDWIGVDLGMVRPVDEVIVHQGRNSVDDSDYYDNVMLEASADGKIWQALTDSLKHTYIVSWAGEPVEARYVRLRRLPSDRTNWASVRTFRVNPPSARRVGLNISAPNQSAALLAFDADPSSAYALNGEMTFNVPAGAKKLIILTGRHSAPIVLKQIDNKGAQTSVKSASPYIYVDVAPSAKQIELSGNAPIYEIIAVK